MVTIVFDRSINKQIYFYYNAKLNHNKEYLVDSNLSMAEDINLNLGYS